jgi:hypothetical protein
MKKIIILSLLSLGASAAILKRPEYVPDENHPGPRRSTQMISRQAEEERPENQRNELNENKIKPQKQVKQLKDTRSLKQKMD